MKQSDDVHESCPHLVLDQSRNNMCNSHVSPTGFQHTRVLPAREGNIVGMFYKSTRTYKL